jgi:hypothetical protein
MLCLVLALSLLLTGVTIIVCYWIVLVLEWMDGDSA